ncbi:hypothetical protein LJB99_06485, partial [Deltaproteobacteria bacterium OttesenSCG-928-K17]|nr:hypothetical protein [Deltaproteobacteria bacterium OttesenSCG-928-K17]
KARSGRRFEKSGPQAGPGTTAPAKTTAPGKASAPGKTAAPGKAPAPAKGAEAPKVEADYKALAGIYVECPRKNPERCPAARDEFREIFPNGQPHPYFMIRKDGRGYLAANERFTTNFTVQSHNPDHIVIRLDDQKKTIMNLKRNGEIWRNPKGGEIYVLTVTDAEWNPDPQPFKKIHERGKK